MRYILGFVFIVMALVSSCAIGANAYIRYQCEKYAQITGKDTRYVEFDSCYIKTSEGFQRWDEYKARAVASEGLKAK